MGKNKGSKKSEEVVEESEEVLEFTLIAISEKPKSTYTKEGSKFDSLLDQFMEMEVPLVDTGMRASHYLDDYNGDNKKAYQKLERVRRGYKTRAEKRELPVSVSIADSGLYLERTDME
jgi:hypothetical protein